MSKVRTRKRGKTYSYIFEAGKTSDGKRKVIEKGGFQSVNAAYTAGVEAFTDWKHGNIGITSEHMTLTDFIQLWQKRIKNDIRLSTLENYESIINCRIIPVLGDNIVQDLRPSTVDNWLQNLYLKGYSKGYIRQCRMILNEVLDYAVYPCELIASNPCVYTKVPKKAKKKVVKRHLISADRFHELMQVYPSGHAMRMPVALMWFTGMRISEVLGLTWEDINFTEQSISVNHQRLYFKSQPPQITETKTEQSKRKIFFSDELRQLLLEEQKRQGQLSIINAVDEKDCCYSFSSNVNVKAGYKPIHLVCVTQLGKMTSLSSVCTYLRLQGLNSHSFRHTQATRLSKAKVSPMTAARRLGHSKPDITLATYTHDTEDQQKEAVTALELAEWDKFFSS